LMSETGKIAGGMEKVTKRVTKEASGRLLRVKSNTHRGERSFR